MKNTLKNIWYFIYYDLPDFVTGALPLAICLILVMLLVWQIGIMMFDISRSMTDFIISTSVDSLLNPK